MMKSNLSRMAVLWEREWRRGDKGRVSRQLGIELVLVALVCILYIAGSQWLTRLWNDILRLPDEVKAFLNVTGQTDTEGILFYIRRLLLWVNVWIAWKGSSEMISSFWEEEYSGSILLLVNQCYSRIQIALAKYLWGVLKLIIYYGFLLLAVLVMAGSSQKGQRWTECCYFTGFFVRCIVVNILILSLSGAYAMLASAKTRQRWTDVLILGTLAVGNLWKARDLAALLLRQANRSFAGFLRKTMWMDGLRWLSPLSWLNPFMEYTVKENVMQMLLCLLIAAAAVALGVTGYKVRRIG